MTLALQLVETFISVLLAPQLGETFISVLRETFISVPLALRHAKLVSLTPGNGSGTRICWRPSHPLASRFDQLLCVQDCLFSLTIPHRYL